MDTYKKEERCLPEGLEAAGISKTGYEVLARYQSWRVAVITYARRFDRQYIRRLERHKETDEVFLLVKGTAALFIGRDGQSVDMEPYKVYNVKCGVWHGICVSSDAIVVICEEANTGPDNTEYMDWICDN